MTLARTVTREWWRRHLMKWIQGRMEERKCRQLCETDSPLTILKEFCYRGIENRGAVAGVTKGKFLRWEK